MSRSLLATAIVVFSGTLNLAQELVESPRTDANLAKRLANPVPTLISVPIQANWDGRRPGRGSLAQES